MSEHRHLRVFVSGVASVSHLVPVAACLRAMVEQAGPAGVTVVDLGLVPFLGQPRVTESDLEAALPDHPLLRVVHARSNADWFCPPGESLQYLAVGAPGIKPYGRLLLANRRRPYCLVVDEGLGTYGDWRARFAAGRRQGGPGAYSVLRALLRAVAVSSAAALLTDEQWALHIRTTGGWRTEPRLAAEYHRRMQPGDGASSRCAVLLSQPWVELGLLTAKRYVAVLHEVERACAAAGLELVVRPHPAEDPALLAGLRIQPSTVPAELDGQVVQAVRVLGWNSTALVNLHALHGTPVLRLAVPELAEVERRLSRRQRSLLATYVEGPVALEALAAYLSAATTGRTTGPA